MNYLKWNLKNNTTIVKYFSLLFCYFFLLLSTVHGEVTLARIIVEAGQYDRNCVPVSIQIDGLGYNFNDQFFKLEEIIEKKRVNVPFQIEQEHCCRLWWILSGVTQAGKTRLFELVAGDSINYPADIFVRKLENEIVLQKLDKKILQYNYGTVYPPENVNPIFKKSGFIHPLWSPNGSVLTRIQPADHYHHYGIWAPWTKTKFQGRQVDFWNLGEGQGTVKFAKFLTTTEGPVYSGFKALQEHVDYTAKGEDKVALNEILDIRVWNIGQKNSVWLLDYSSTFNCVSDSAVELLAYRYGGGLGYRATEEWTKENCSVITSEGKDRNAADGTKARWCIVEGDIEGAGVSGIVFMSFPGNRDYPEPMRVWPDDAVDGRGDLFFEFCPIRHKNWTITPGKNYVLKYRLMVYEGQMTSESAEQYWRDFAYPPKVSIQ